MGIYGTKAGMMQFYRDGISLPATVIALGEGNIVTQVKTADKDGYAAVQVRWAGACLWVGAHRDGMLRARAG